jgi:hypothetical protein
MARDEDDDLYDEDFDFVDEEENGSDAEEDAASEGDDTPLDDPADDEEADEEVVDEYGRPEPAANYVVHIYEHRRFKRTVDRPFTPEDAEAFATEYNRTAKLYHRVAVAGKNDTQPKKTLG